MSSAESIKYRPIPPFESVETFCPVSKFVLRAVNDYKFKALAKIGYTTLVVGLGAVALSVKSPHRILFLGTGSGVTIIALSIIFGKRTLERMYHSLSEKQGQIETYEKAHDYRSALSLARNLYAPWQHLGLDKTPYSESSRYLQILKHTIKKLETRFLSGMPQLYLFDQAGEPFPATKSVVILEAARSGAPYSLSDINLFCGQHLLKPTSSTKEAWENLGVNSLFTQLGLVETVKPSFTNYEGVVVPFISQSCMREQLAYIAEQWNQGIRFKSITFFATQDQMCDREVIAEQLKWPAALKAITTFSYSDYNLKNQYQHLNYSQDPYLFVVGAPYIPLSDLTTRKNIPQGQPFETAGPRLPLEKRATYFQQIALYTQERVKMGHNLN